MPAVDSRGRRSGRWAMIDETGVDSMSDKPSMEMSVASIEDAIDDIRNGKIVIVVDDEDFFSHRACAPSRFIKF